MPRRSTERVQALRLPHLVSRPAECQAKTTRVHSVSRTHIDVNRIIARLIDRFRARLTIAGARIPYPPIAFCARCTRSSRVLGAIEKADHFTIFRLTSRKTLKDVLELHSCQKLDGVVCQRDTIAVDSG